MHHLPAAVVAPGLRWQIHHEARRQPFCIFQFHGHASLHCWPRAHRTLHFSLILGPRKILRAGWKKSCRSVPYSIFGLMARKRQSENAPKAGNPAKSNVSHYTFSELKNSVGLVHLLSFFCDFCCQYSSEFAASFQLCQFSKLQARSFKLLLLTVDWNSAELRFKL